MKVLRFTILFLLLLPWTGLHAQEDVCCILGKKVGDSGETRAMVMSSTDCKSGGGEQGFQVCRSQKDTDNLCSMLSDEDRCKTCGFFWAGKACLTEDPVKKAKEGLKKEKGAKGSTSQESPPPKKEETSPTPVEGSELPE